MSASSKRLKFQPLGIFFVVFLIGVLLEAPSFLGNKDDESNLGDNSGFVVSQDNTLMSLSNPTNPPVDVVRRFPVVLTGYSSTPGQTDNSPYITASGTFVRDGVVANNLLSFGAKIRIPELYGDKIFIVEDRMSSKKGYYHVDVWFPDYWQALSFGAKKAYIEVLEE